ncbi:hypothetical protein NL676_005276 [Syzygium grande]|nr:hypothetical protein NL676_005276 [Syzygium grande]
MEQEVIDHVGMSVHNGDESDDDSPIRGNVTNGSGEVFSNGNSRAVVTTISGDDVCDERTTSYDSERDEENETATSAIHSRSVSPEGLRSQSLKQRWRYPLTDEIAVDCGSSSNPPWTNGLRLRCRGRFESLPIEKTRPLSPQKASSSFL